MSNFGSEFNDISTITCHDLFSMTALSNLKLLAGGRQLSNPIHRVNIMEVPDIQNWAQQHEFLITTGYSYQNNLDGFLELIPKLVEKGVSAFAIKPRRFIEEIPQSVIDCAEQYGLPLFELADETIFSNVVREVMETVVSSETSAILKMQDRLSYVSSLMLQGTSLSKILEELSDLLGNPIAVVAPTGKLLTSKNHQLLFEYCYEQLMIKDLRHDAHDGHSMIELQINEAERSIAQCYSLTSMNEETMLTILIEQQKPCTSLDLATIKHIQPYLNIRISSEVLYEQVKNKYLNDFLKDWLTGHIKSAEELDEKGKLYQLEHLSKTNYRVAIIYFASDLYVHPDLLALSDLNSQADKEIMFTINENQLTVIVPETLMSDEQAELQQLRLRNLVEKTCLTTEFTICLGESFAALSLLDAVEDAQRLYVAAKACGEKSDVITWDKLGIYALLTLLPAHKNVDRFFTKYIEPIIEYDNQHHSSLLQTLKAYFQMGRNTKLTAHHMFTHYNTVVYRLDKIKSILDVSFDNPDIQFNLLLALKLYEMKQPS